MPRVFMTDEELTKLSPILSKLRHQAEIDTTWNAAIQECQRALEACDPSETLSSISIGLESLKRK